jgi:uncharacterized protein (TIGR02246 family)
MMRLAPLVVCLVAALAGPGLAARGQAQADAEDLSGVVVALATRESASYVKAFNERKLQDLAALLTPDADVTVLEGSSVETLVEFSLVRGRERIVACHDTLFDMYPDARLKQTVTQARRIRPDVLIADVEFEITGIPASTGAIRGRAVSVRVLESGAWKLAAERIASWTAERK